MNMKTMFLKLAATALIAGVFAVGLSPRVSGQQNQPSGTQKTLTGVISDSMCASTHMLKYMSPAECTRMCAQQGQKHALVVGKKVYVLDGHEEELNKLAGQRVVVKGSVSGTTVSVASVTPVKGPSPAK